MQMTELFASGLADLQVWLTAHARVAPFVLGGIMLLEGIIFTTFIFSGSVILVAAGALIQQGVLPYWPSFAAVVIGFWAGDTVNFLLGRHGETWMRGTRLVRRHEALLKQAEGFLTRWDTAAIFLSRFMGPTRPFITLLAGTAGVPARVFHAMTLLATVLLTAGLFNAGSFGMQLWKSFPK
jgi:membrane protein DedA with SNARE-associated domain